MVVASVIALGRRCLARFGTTATLPLAVLAGGAAVVLLSIVGVARTESGTAYAIDEAQQLLAGVAGVVATLLAARTEQPGRRFVCLGIAIATGCSTLGMAVWYLQPNGWVAGAGPGEMLFAVAVISLLMTLARSMFAGLYRDYALGQQSDRSFTYLW